MLETSLIPTALNSISQANNDLNDQLEAASVAFSNDEVYPYLQQLKQSMEDLVYLKEQQPNIQTALDQGKDLTSLKPVEKLLKLDSVSEANVRDNIKKTFMFVQWAIPAIQNQIEEGKNRHYAIESSLIYEWSNLSSADKFRGYIFINTPLDSNDYVKVYYCKVSKKSSNVTSESHRLNSRKDILQGKPSIVQKEFLEQRSMEGLNPPMVWVTDLDNYPLRTLKQVVKHTFVSRLIESATKKQM